MAGITSAPPQPRINAAQRRANNQFSQQPHRVNAAERRLINQGQMPAQSNYQGNPQQPRPQAPTSGPQTGGGAQMAPQQGFNQMGMQPIPRPTFQNPKQFAPGQFPQLPQGFGQPIGYGVQGMFGSQFGGQQFTPYGGGYGGGNGMQPQYPQQFGPQQNTDPNAWQMFTKGQGGY